MSVPSPDSILACLLPLSFDAEAIAEELETVQTERWTRHFNEQVYTGDWTGLPVRAPGGDPSRIDPDLTKVRPFADTCWLEALPATRQLLTGLALQYRAVRFLRLASGARIFEHRDYDLGIERGELRIHGVVQTHADVEFVVGGVQLTMRPGELWYADFHEPHRVSNRSPHARTHLVIDCVADPVILDLIAASCAAIPRNNSS